MQTHNAAAKGALARGAKKGRELAVRPGEQRMLEQCDGVLSKTVDLMNELENELLFDRNSTAEQLGAVRYLRDALRYMRHIEGRMRRGDDDAFPELMQHVGRALGRVVAHQLDWTSPHQHPVVWRVQTVAVLTCAAAAMRFALGLGWLVVAAGCAALLLLRHAVGCWRGRTWRRR